MLERIKIQNFRGIRNLLLEDLRRVNIFIGTNAVGKTSALEAISLALNPISAQWPITLSGWRDLPKPTSEQDDALRSFFPNLDPTVNPTFIYTVDGEKYEYQLSSKLGSEIQSSGSGSGESSLSHITEIIQELKQENRSSLHARLSFSNNGMTFNAPRGAFNFGIFYIHARRSTSVGETAKLLTRLYETKQDGALLSSLQVIDERVVRLWPGVRDNGPVVLVDVGQEQMLPLNLLGDGFCRVALMATGLLRENQRALFVDEIDSGIHYSVMKSVWKMLSSVSIGKQIFCATHNEEMLQAASDAFETDPESLRVFRIDRLPDGSLHAESYSYESYSSSLRAGLEVR